MKLFVAQVLAFFILKETWCLDISHYATKREQEHHVQKKPIIPILKYITEQSQKGWKYSYESGNGIHSEQTGYIKNHGDEKHESLVQQGSVTYHDEHGHPITLTYIADENGFQPQGDHLPKIPPLSEDNQKGSDAEEDIKDEVHQQEQEEYEEKGGYEQAQSYAESRLHSKTLIYEQGSGQRYNPGKGYGSRQHYGR